MGTLRIYGDSFGSVDPNIAPGWPMLLSKKLKMDLVSKAVGGGSTEYAALQFFNDIQNNEIADGDVIIYIPSIIGRLHFDWQISRRPETAGSYLHEPNNHSGKDHSWYYKNKNHIEWWMDNYSYDVLYMNNEAYINLISNVARTKPKTTFIIIKHAKTKKVNAESDHPTNLLLPNIHLGDISEKEVIGGYNYNNFVEFTKFDPRCNHLTKPNFTILADIIYECIITKSVENFTIDKFNANVIAKITSIHQYLEYVDQEKLDYIAFIGYHLKKL